MAVKLLDVRNSLQGVEEYANEARLLGTLRHPHLVQVIAKCNERFAVVMELMEGGSLQERLDGGDFAWWDCVRVLHQSALGILFLHNQERPIMHRDIKPSNILLTSDLRAKVSDVGLAKQLGSNASHVTTATMVSGTFHYMCPEYQSGGQYRPACDVYSVGVMIAVAVTNR